MLGDYVKTVWNESIGITPIRLNNIENKVEELDKAIASSGVKAPYTLYVDGTNGIDSNNGLSSGTAVKTISQAIALAKLSICASITIAITAGTYAENLVLDGILASQITITVSGSGTVQINGGISWSDGQKLKLQWINITGTATCILNNIEAVEITGCTILSTDRSAIYIDGAHVVRIGQGNISSNSTYSEAISLTNVGSAVVNMDQVRGKDCISANNVGSLNISDGSWTANAGSSAGLILSQGTTCYMSGVTGALGTVPVCRVSGSVLIKGANNITGAADVKSNGGQIFA